MKRSLPKQAGTRTFLAGLLAVIFSSHSTTFAAGLQADDGVANNRLGSSVSQFGSLGLVGADGNNANRGAAYAFRALDTATGIVTQNVKLTASDAAVNDLLGYSVSLSGNTGLVGAPSATISGNAVRGAAYLYRNLNGAGLTATQDVKLIASDGASNDALGSTVSLSGNIGLVTAYTATVGGNANQGAAYVFRNLDTATGTTAAPLIQNIKLTASDGAASDRFGSSASLSGTLGVVGAPFNNANLGAAYVFRNLDTATGTTAAPLTQNTKLTASDGAAPNFFGFSSSLSGNTGLIGAYGATVAGHSFQGAAYLYRNLNIAGSTASQDVKLIASDGSGGDTFGWSVSLSGSTGLVGAWQASVGGNSKQGVAYLYRNLDTATGTVNQNVRLTASDGAADDAFGFPVGLDGDQFVIAAEGRSSNTGKAYSGSVASVTTLDTGGTKIISGISFVSQDDWIIGQTTSGNQVTLSKGDTANVTAASKGIFIGKTAGSNNNTLLVRGTVTANTITAGISGSTGNKLEIANDGSTTAGTVAATNGITLNAGGKLLLSGSGTVTDRIGTTTPLTLAGGTFDTGGLSEGTATGAGSNGVPTTGLGALSLTANSVVDFGAGTSVLTFADSHLANWTGGTTLSIYNWSGAGSDTDRLFFGSTNAGLDPTWLGRILFYTGSGTGPLGTASINSHGELEAIPEPSTWGMLAVGVALLATTARHRRSL